MKDAIRGQYMFEFKQEAVRFVQGEETVAAAAKPLDFWSDATQLGEVECGWTVAGDRRLGPSSPSKWRLPV